MSNIWEKPASHGEILKHIWKHLDLGTLERSHPFHTPVFGTVFDNQANLRVVVLRRFWRRPPQLAFHSHSGAPKIREIQENPFVSWAFYHPAEKLQLRVKGRATIHAGDHLAEEQWQATELFSRRCYVGEAPSQESRKPTSGLPGNLIDREPTREESEFGKANFAVVAAKIERIDCLELAVKGHRRSLFVWHDDNQIEMKWLTP
jgi:3-hydroxyisobutyrate dehydrogenase